MNINHANRAGAVISILVMSLLSAACAPSRSDVDAIVNQALDDANEQAAAITSEVDANVADALEEANAAVEEGLAASGDVDAQVQELLSEVAEAGGLSPAEDEESKPDASDAAAPPESDSSAELVNGQHRIAGVDRAAAALRAEVGAEDLELLLVRLTLNGAIAFQVRDPNIPENVDEYTWNGERFAAPAPVRVVGDGDLASSVFSISEVSSAGVQAAYDTAQGLEIEDGQVGSITLQINPFDGLAWSVPISGSRDSNVVYAAPSGETLRIV